METLLQSPMFGILLSLLAFECAILIQKKTKLLILNPLMVAIVMVILFLVVTQIDLSYYQVGGDIINMFLGPATVVLAVPLYRQIHNLKAYFIPILCGIFIGTLVGLCSILLCSVLFGFDLQMMASLLPKSVTTPIGVELSKQLGGIPSITIFNILITGIVGAVGADFICKVLKITEPVAKGIAIGTSAHALGTTKALQLGQTEGAMSSLAIGIAGIMTVLLAPLLWNLVLPLLA
ncbi:MAG: LrgB family protein [Erysipelotrichaceae bacterium]|nr:LrgB family protein [Erysipelotrichaceae bacterium]